MWFALARLTVFPHRLRLSIISCISQSPVAARNTRSGRAQRPPLNSAFCILPSAFLHVPRGRAQRPHLHGLHRWKMHTMALWDSQEIS
jgi:hypothetical protein